MKLLIGIPSIDYMHAEFVKCLTALTIRLCQQKIPFDVFINNGTLVHVARDKIACKAINKDYTHVLWLDADMIFQPTVLEDLMDTGHDFVTGIAHSRRPPYASCVFENIDDLDHLKRFEGVNYPVEPFPVAGCGFACVLIKTEVLKAVQLHYKTCFLPELQWGEDLTFCRRARAMGYDIYADPCVRLGHIGHDVIWPEDHQRYLERIEGMSGNA